MNFYKALSILAVVILGCSPPTKEKENTIEVNFSPNGGVTDAIVREINMATKEVLVQAYSCTSIPIGDAIMSAYDRGVKVEVIMDPENLGNPNSLIKPFFNKGISIFIDNKHNIAHNKIMIIDHYTVITGSFNFSKGAEHSNSENNLIIKNSQITNRYIVNYTSHKQHSYNYGN